MAVTRAQLIEAFPEFSVIAQDRVTLYIGFAEDILNETEIGPSKYTMMVILLACHLLSIAEEEGQSVGGAVISDKVGSIQVSYAIPSQGFRSDPELMITAYGRTFLMYRRLVFPGRVT